MVVALVALLGVPSYAHADVGTPLMWASAFHLLIGNAFIGMVEGTLLAWFFSVNKAKTLGIMVAANYFSAWAGAFLLSLSASYLESSSLNINNGWRWFWILAGASYLLTLILEWPFVALCFWKKQNWFQLSLKGNLIVQSASYAVLFGWYWMASVTSLYTEMKVVPISELDLPKTVQIYYIADEDGDVYSADLDGKNARKVYDLKSKSKNDRLFVEPGKDTAVAFKLMANVEEKEFSKGTPVEILPHFSSRTASSKEEDERDQRGGGSWFKFGRPQVLDGTASNEWEFRSGFWAAEGFKATNKDQNASFRFGYETLYGNWMVRNITHLPGDIALFQLGKRQICVVDPHTKKVALVTFGRGPIAVLRETQ